METKKEALKSLIERMNDEQVDFLYSLLSTGKYITKGDLVKLFTNKDWQKIDSAYPVDYFRRIENIYPDLKNGRYVFDYNSNFNGELVNLNNHVADKLLEFLGSIM